MSAVAHVIRFYETGGPEVLRWEPADVGDPGPGQVRIRHHAVGLNFNDIYVRRGTYAQTLPSGIGREGAGVVEAVGSGVQGFRAGDRVTYTSSPLGAYATQRLIDARCLIKLPDALAFELAAAMTMRGLTAAYVLRRLHAWSPGDSLLLYAAAGGVGLIVCQWARILGLRVIGVVSSDSKARVAQAHGCEQVIVHTREPIPDRVRALTSGRGVSAVIDTVGADFRQATLESLARRGLWVGLGASSGALPPIDPMDLARRGSLFFTRPALADYTAEPQECDALAGELFAHVLAGRIQIPIHQRYALREVARAHADLEGGLTTGSSILTL